MLWFSIGSVDEIKLGINESTDVRFLIDRYEVSIYDKLNSYLNSISLGWKDWTALGYLDGDSDSFKPGFDEGN